MLAIATVKFRGVRVDNDTSCGVDISPCGVFIGSGGYTSNVQCNSDGVYATPYKLFYRWNSDAVLNPGDLGVFTVCNAREVQLKIYRTCQGCRKTYQTVLSAQRI